MLLRIFVLLCLFSFFGCAKPVKINDSQTINILQSIEGGPFPSTYQALPREDLLLTNASILDGAGNYIDTGDVLIQAGKIVSVATSLTAPPGIKVVDVSGSWLTPGLIDTHSHFGVFAVPLREQLDLNELSDPNTANVWAEHSINVQDVGFTRSLAGGVTTMQVLPGSANLFGGRGVILKNVPARTVQAMKFPAAPYSLKMACGENPIGNYGAKGRFPTTPMGNMAGYRQAWIKAKHYQQEWEKYLKAGDGSAEEPKRDLKLDTLAAVLSGDILVHMHCYRADEMAQMLDLAKEFNYRISAFHHAVEAYKIADILAEENVCVATWADWWGFKKEAGDGIRENLAYVDAANGCAIVHSDSLITSQRLNLDAATALAAGQRMGINIKKEHAIQWLTLNAAKSLGLDHVIGSIEPGKNADLVLWSGDPFSVYSQVKRVFIDGAVVYERGNPTLNPSSDFELGPLYDDMGR